MTIHSHGIPEPHFPHIVNARRSFTLYAVMAAGLLFVFTALTIDPARDCAAYDCPVWLRGLAFGIGALFAAGAALAMIRKCEWGSRIDREARQIVWWHGPSPRREKTIAIDCLAVVRVETTWDSDRLILRDRIGKKVYMPAECAPHPLADWGRALAREFPHLTFESD